MGSCLKEVEYWENQAESYLNAAELLKDNGFYKESVSSAYYAILYTIKSLFVKDKVSAYKPKSILIVLGRNYVKPGLLGASFHRNILQIFDKYYSLNFNPYIEVEMETVQEILKMTKEIQLEIFKHLKINDISKNENVS